MQTLWRLSNPSCNGSCPYSVLTKLLTKEGRPGITDHSKGVIPSVVAWGRAAVPGEITELQVVVSQGAFLSSLIYGSKLTMIIHLDKRCVDSFKNRRHKLHCVPELDI